MENDIYFSVIMPTLNSEKTLEMALLSIRNQVFDQNRVEILVLDGGSEDTTTKIALKYDCKIISNSKVQQEYGKHLGILNSRGAVCLFLDSDEILEDVYSFQKREDIFKTFYDVKVLLFGGYKKPEGSSYVNDYINYFSDPFTFFVSGVPTEFSIMHDAWKRRYQNFEDRLNHVLFKIDVSTHLPQVDMCAGNCFIREYYVALVQKRLDNPMIIPSIFYEITHSTHTFGMLTGSPTLHYSADSLSKYVKKLAWRVKVNLHFKDIPGTGYSNRESFQPTLSKYKKYLFIPFAFSIVGPLMSSIRKSIKYKKVVFMLNLPLTLFVASCIVYYYVLLLLKIRPRLKSYGKGEVELKL